MNNILYTQNESATVKNTLIVNDEIFVADDENVSDKLRFIFGKSNEKSSYSKQIEKFKKKGKISSLSFSFNITQSGILIKSSFQEKDDLGRYMPYIFYTESIDINEACNILKVYAAMINRKCFYEDLEQIPEIISKKKEDFFIKLILSTATLVLLFVLTILFVKL